MAKRRITNETGEPFVLEPGETVDIRCEEDREKILVGHLEMLNIKEVIDEK